MLGGIVTGIGIFKWIYLVIIAGSLYMGLGKRRNELKVQTETREVLKHYNEGFLEKGTKIRINKVTITKV